MLLVLLGHIDHCGWVQGPFWLLLLTCEMVAKFVFPPNMPRIFPLKFQLLSPFHRPSWPIFWCCPHWNSPFIDAKCRCGDRVSFLWLLHMRMHRWEFWDKRVLPQFEWNWQQVSCTNDQTVIQSVVQYTAQSVMQSVMQLVMQPIMQPVMQSGMQPVMQSGMQPVMQPVMQPIARWNSLISGPMKGYGFVIGYIIGNGLCDNYQQK